MENPGTIGDGERIQLHLVLPYKIEPRDDPRIRGYLDRGYRILELQRVTDHEVLITLTGGVPVE